MLKDALPSGCKNDLLSVEEKDYKLPAAFAQPLSRIPGEAGPEDEEKGAGASNSGF
jgi:hypothetical protein